MRTVLARAAAIVVAAMAVALVPATAAHAVPVVAIITPGNGDVVAGTVRVEVSATGDSGDTPVGIGLQVDGTPVNLSDTQCPATTTDPPPCVLQIPWDTSSGTVGTHALTATFTEQLGGSVTSDPVSVTVEKAPVVAIDSPGSGAPVDGPIDVQVSASTDPADSDPPSTITLTATPQGGSPFTLGTKSCGATPCSGGVHWDPSGLDGAVVLRATVRTVNGITTTVTRSVVVESPTVAITAPTETAVVSGQVQVTAHATSTQAALDGLTSIDLLVDGTKVDSLLCAAPTSGTCDLVLAWDATAVPSGTHTLSTRLTTQLGLVVTGAAVHVTVTPPPAIITITTPHSSTVVSRGTVKVTVSASTNVRALDHPQRIDLFVDGGRAQGVLCTTTASRCIVVLKWSTLRLAGQHRVTARVTTEAGGSVFSSRVYVWVRTGAVTRLSRMPASSSGRTVALRGRVVSTTTGRGLGGASVRISLVTTRGAAVVRLVTRSDGTFALTLRPYITTRIYTRAAASWLTASQTSVTQLVRAPIICRLSSTSVRAGSTGKGLCTVSALPRGTPVSLYYTINRHTTLLASGAAHGPAIPFTYRFSARGFYTLRVVIGASANYVATRGAALGVTVR